MMMRNRGSSALIFLCVFVLLFGRISTNNYHRYHVYSVTPNSEEAFTKLHGLENDQEGYYDLWNAPGKINMPFHIMVAPKGLWKFNSLCTQLNITKKLLKKDISRDVFRDRREFQGQEYLSRSKRAALPIRSMHGRFLRYHEMVTILKTIEKNFPYARTITIGKSAEGRDLVGFHISKNDNLPLIWIDAGIHAREWIAPAAALFVIDRLLSDAGNSLLKKHQFFILPNVNPDGYVYAMNKARLWRKNRSNFHGRDCIGADLNRNFPYKWGGYGSSDSACSYTFRGSKPASEPETQAIIRKLIDWKNKLALYLTLHSYGQLILTPFGYTKHAYPKNNEQLQLMGNKVAKAIEEQNHVSYEVGPASELLYEAPGGADDFVSGELGVNYSYTIELADQGRYGFFTPATYIRPVGRHLWTALKTFSENLK